MSAPWLKFYPSDWRSEPSLRLCSIAARGLWLELICLMHEAEPYGHATTNGEPLTDRKIAALAGVSVKDATRLLGELEAEGVFSRTAEGVIFSRRMVRDEKRAAEDKANGKRGGNPKLRGGVNPPDNPTPNPTDNGGNKAQKPEARSQSSDADASAHEGDDADPDAQAWALAVDLLTKRGGLPDRHARTFFGGLLKRHGVRASDMLVPLVHAEDCGTPDLQPYLTQAAQNLKTPRLIHDRGLTSGAQKLVAVAGAMRAARSDRSTG